MRAGVIVLVGVPGAGKSTLAAALVERLAGARVIDKDKVRHALFAPCDYTAAERDITFAAMLDAARYHLGRGRIVVFDGLTFSRRSEVAAAQSVAGEDGGFSAVIVCDVPVAVAIKRVERDRAEGDHLAANRDADLVRRVADEMEEPPGDYLTLAMQADLDAAIVAAVEYVQGCAE